jgi:hypothetical protein
MNRVGRQPLDNRRNGWERCRNEHSEHSDSSQKLHPASQAETRRHFCTGK